MVPNVVGFWVLSVISSFKANVYHLVGGLEHDWIMIFHILGMSSSQLTNSYFSERLKPPTRKCIYIYYLIYINIIYHTYIIYIYINTYIYCWEGLTRCFQVQFPMDHLASETSHITISGCEMHHYPLVNICKHTNKSCNIIMLNG